MRVARRLRKGAARLGVGLEQAADLPQVALERARQAQAVLRPLGAEQDGALDTPGVAPDRGERELGAVARAQELERRGAQGPAEVFEVVRALDGVVPGQVDPFRLHQRGARPRPLARRGEQLVARHGTVERVAPGFAADQGGPGHAGAALVEGDHVGDLAQFQEDGQEGAAGGRRPRTAGSAAQEDDGRLRGGRGAPEPKEGQPDGAAAGTGTALGHLEPAEVGAHAAALAGQLRGLPGEVLRRGLAGAERAPKPREAPQRTSTARGLDRFIMPERRKRR